MDVGGCSRLLIFLGRGWWAYFLFVIFSSLLVCFGNVVVGFHFLTFEVTTCQCDTFFGRISNATFLLWCTAHAELSVAVTLLSLAHYRGFWCLARTGTSQMRIAILDQLNEYWNNAHFRIDRKRNSFNVAIKIEIEDGRD